jgi:hypothetical protein
MLHLEHSFVWCWNSRHFRKNRSEIPWKFWNMMREEDGEQLDQLRKKWRHTTYSQGRKEHLTYNKMKEGYLDWLYLA